MLINYEEGRYYASCTYEERLVFRTAGWTFSSLRQRWETSKDELADPLIDHAVGSALLRLSNIRTINASLILASHAMDTETVFWHPEGEKYLGFQKAGIEFMLPREHSLLADEPGTGKGQRLTDRIYCKDGWKTFSEIRVGDMVYSSDGELYPVTGVFPRGKLQTYRVTFSDKSSLVVDGDHIWKAKQRTYKNRVGEVIDPPWRERSTLNLMQDTGKLLRRKIRIPIVQPLDIPEVLLPLNPYLLGALIGDGGIKYADMFSSGDKEILDKVKVCLPVGCTLRQSSKYDYCIKGTGGYGGNIVRNELKTLNLFGKGPDDKFIPQTYMHCSEKQTKELLAGLFDTDGFISDTGSTVNYSSNSKILVEQVVELVQRVGGTGWITSKISASGKQHYTAVVRTTFCPFNLKRKVDRWIPANPLRIIKQIEIAEVEEIVCISVASPDHTYVTEGMIVTHNTIQSLGVFTNTPNAKTMLVIAPASLKYNWLREARKWLREGQTVGVTTTKPKTTKAPLTHLWPSTDVVITTYDMLPEYYAKIREKVWDLMVCDEAQLLANQKTIRTKQVFGGGRGVKRVEEIRCKKSIYATGTPILKRPIDLWPIVHKCDPTGLGLDYMVFIRRYCGAFQNHFGWITDGATNLDELQFRLRSTFMLRRMKKDVLKELPPKIRQIVELPPEGTKKLVKKEFEVFEKNLERLLSANEDRDYDEDVFQTVSLDVLSTFIDDAKARAVDYAAVHNQEYELEDYLKLHFEAMSLAREEIGLAKVPMVLEYVRRLIENDEKVVIMCVHKAVAEELKRHFNNCAFITGKVSAKRRDLEVHRFQTDPDCNVFIGNIAAAGVGITLTAACHLIFAELSWSPAEMEQAEDRIHRIGQCEVAHIHYLVIRGSMEAGVIDKLIEKQEIINQALNIA